VPIQRCFQSIAHGRVTPGPRRMTS
jgi:hypothetical protein